MPIQANASTNELRVLVKYNRPKPMNINEPCIIRDRESVDTLMAAQAITEKQKNTLQATATEINVPLNLPLSGSKLKSGATIHRIILDREKNASVKYNIRNILLPDIIPRDGIP